MYLYNSLSHKKELFQPNSPDVVKIYTCGPTVYHFAHIGNLRTYIMEDVLEKTLRYMGYNVKRVMNITDVGHLASDALPVKIKCSRAQNARTSPLWRLHSTTRMHSLLTATS